MSTHANRVKMTVASVAADPYTITLDAASTGFRSFATAYGANATVDVLITMGTTWEIARNCTYTHSGTTLSRGTLESSSTGSRITTFDNTAVVSVIATAGFGNAVDNALGAWGALNGENSITGTATAVIGRLNVCSGTSSNYTVTLPAVSGNSGKYIGFRMAAGLTKLVTLDADGTETIDGSLTRVMWSGETALLYCDGSTWTKVAGKSIPMFCSMKRNTTQSISASTETALTLNTVVTESPSGLGNTGTGKITLVRGSTYIISSAMALLLGANSANNQIFSRLDGTKIPMLGLMPGLNGQYVGPNCTQVVTANAGQYFESATYSDASGTIAADTGHLVVSEVPTW